MIETPEERARRLGLVSGGETPAQRAQRLGLVAAPASFREGHSKFTPVQLEGRADRAVATAEDEQQDAETTYRERLGGNLGNLIRDVPGGEAVTTALHAAINRQPYAESLKEVRGAEDDATRAPVRFASRVAGGTAAGMLIPGSPALQGARYGILSGALQADPANVEERLHDAAIQGAVGAVLGKTADLAGTGIRAKLGATRGALAAEQAAKTKAADADLFGRVAKESAQSGGTSPAIRAALDQPDIKPLVEELRASRSFGGGQGPAFTGPSDADILLEVRNRLSEQQSPMIRKLADAIRGRPSVAGDVKEIQLAKKSLVDAAEPSMPSLPEAIRTHATNARIGEAGQLASRVGGRLARGSATPDAKLLSESPEAFERALAAMSPEEAELARRMLTARVGENVSINPFKAFKSVGAVNRVAPFLRQADERAGARVPGLFRSALLTAGTPDAHRF